MHIRDRAKPVVRCLIIALSLCAFGAVGASAQEEGADPPPSGDEMANANNPLASIASINLHNYWTTQLWGLEGTQSNVFWLRGALPTGKILWRANVPFIQNATFKQENPDGSVVQASERQGVGDAQFQAMYLAVQKPTTTFGFGLQTVAPTGDTDKGLGQGVWQLGAAAVVFTSVSPGFQTGGLVLWQYGLDENDNGDTPNFLAIQPFAFWQMGGGTYIRASPIAQFNLEAGTYNVPFALGIGRVVKSRLAIYNLFVEPQYTIFHKGIGQPLFQLYAGINIQIPF